MKLPDAFIESLAILPDSHKIVEALQHEPSPVAIRLNPVKPLHDAQCTMRNMQVPWEPMGVYLAERPQFTFHPALYDGRFYVQDPSAMITGQVIRKLTAVSGDIPLVYLDACAAPGGKTTSALANLPSGSLVVANEYERDRVLALIENVERWGYPDVIVTCSDATGLGKLGPLFDIVAADVPCSGEGMMRKNETAISQWSHKLINDCAALQRRIVESVWQTLKPGGYLIYSTCTLNTIENEGNARWIQHTLGAEPVDVGLRTFPGVMPGVDGVIGDARFMPGYVYGEGQYVAVFRKPGSLDNISFRNMASHVRLSDKTPLNLWLDGIYAYIEEKNGDIYALRPQFLTLLQQLKKYAKVVMPGLHVATPKGRDYMPAHALATSIALNTDAFPSAEVDYPTAIAFLRGEAIKLSPDIPKGYTLITNNGNHLGWVKNLGNRANNLIPQYRRIRSPHVPASCPILFKQS